jgi:SAM-dependent methyltransferase
MVWLDEPPSKSEMSMHYGSDYDRTICTAAKAPEHWFGRRDELLRLKPGGGSVLDLGCATGGFLSTLKGRSWKLYGIEISEEAAAIARHRCGAEIFVGDVLDARFPPDSFDAITCFNVFEHMHEPGAVLSRVAKWLKPGGVFYTMMPNIDSAGARIFRSYWYALELPRHLYHFSPATLKMLGQNSGLAAVAVGAHRELYFDYSIRYVFDDILRRVGISRMPLAFTQNVKRGFAWRVARKAFWVAVTPVINAVASLAGDGETITAVFTKRNTAQGLQTSIAACASSPTRAGKLIGSSSSRVVGICYTSVGESCV